MKTLKNIATESFSNTLLKAFPIPFVIGAAWLISLVMPFGTATNLNAIIAFFFIATMLSFATAATIYYFANKFSAIISVILFAISLYSFGVNDTKVWLFIFVMGAFSYPCCAMIATSELTEVAFKNYVKTGVFTHKDRIYSSIFNALSFEFYALRKCNQILRSKKASENIRKNAKMIRRNLLIREVIFQMKKN